MSLDTYDRPAYDPPGPWRAQAACRGLPADLFHPELGANAKAAKAVCQRCPVAQECLIYALSNTVEFGVWGGLSVVERSRAVRFLGRMRVCIECGKTFYRPPTEDQVGTTCGEACARERRLRLHKRMEVA